MDWNAYLSLARELGQSNASTLSVTAGDAAMRSAISRAYYSAYHCARAYIGEAEVKRIAKGTDGSHRAIWEWLENRKSVQEKNVSTKGQRLRIERNDADYVDRPRKRLAEMVTTSLLDADNIIRSLADALAQGVRERD
jgi:uncharacterized protein (UPF0332 family)